jgi:hypothetical protein
MEVWRYGGMEVCSTVICRGIIYTWGSVWECVVVCGSGSSGSSGEKWELWGIVCK